MKTDFSKLLLYGASGVLVLPVLYSVIMAFIPENDKSILTHAEQKSHLGGEELYSKCAPCHGENADGSEAYPRLNTLTKERFVEMLIGYQQGSYGSDNNKKIMQVQVQGMSLDDMQKLAEFVTSRKPKMRSEEERQKLEKQIKDEKIDITGISS